MSAINYSLRNNFQFVLSNAPITSFTATGVSLPTISINPTLYPTRTHDIKTPGEKIEFDPINVEFIVEENLSNYKEMYDWILKCTSYNGNKMNDIFADASLIILSNNKQPLRTIRFEGIFPGILSEIQFSTQDSEQNISNVTFYYTRFLFVN